MTVLEELESGRWQARVPYLPPNVRTLDDLIVWYQEQFPGKCNPNIIRGEVSIGTINSQ